MIKSLQKEDYYLSLMRVAHCFFVRGEILCGVDKNTSSDSKIFRKLEKENIGKWLTLTGKESQGNTRKKLSRAYHLIVSIFSLFLFIFGLN